MNELYFPLEDGFLAWKVLKEDFNVYGDAKEKVNLMIQGRRQSIMGEHETDSLNATTEWLKLLIYQKERKLTEVDARILLFELLTFSGNYKDYWLWLIDKVIACQGRKFYDACI